ncbi:response regulator [Ramlibacter algicola]|uniref:Sensory/regulatory protein RpfC n=1 Tax=Ramlibacter algicola TaxID=2795217 RepID=A0A934USH7_9BURK|nr:response regulator [Ramlibacter algicola]
MTPQTPPPANTPLKILVAEDSRTQAERLQHLLRQQDYEVAIAANGRLALEMLPAFRPDLVISDVNMPEVDGYELSRRMKALPDFHDVPVILVTTMSDPQDVIRGLECGADNFVLKPYDERYMLGRVRYVLANREMRRPDDPGMGVGIFFNGQRHFITADRLQILNLLLSTYEAAIQRNRELTESKESLEQRSAEIALANRFLDQVIENIPHMIFVKDAHDLSFIRVNRAFEEVTGLSKERAVGKNVDDFFPPEQAAFFKARDREVLVTGTIGSFDEPVQTAHRGLRTLHTRKLAIYDELEQPRFVLGISEDVTDKKEREAEILRLNAALERRTAEADAANRAKGTFLATMSHEIRTPMNGMLGMLELLSLTRLDEEQRATLEVIRASSASLLRIVDDVLDFSKIEAGQMEIRPEPGSIAQVLKDVERMHAPAAAGRGLKIGSSVDPGISPVLRVDILRLRQILDNFVSNALKFTTEGSVEIVAQGLGRQEGRERIRFQVRDTGIGISPENQRRLFQPFSQGDAEAARRAGGTGLGLTICRRLAQMMGGSVDMASELGRGTTMTLDLAFELVDEPAQEPVAADEGAATIRPRRARDAAQAEREGTLVLLVDDHPTNRMLLQRQLNTLGYAADTAEDGHQAFRMWQSGRYCIVITDCEMPGMDGYELARAIRAEEHARGAPRTPVLACTAHALAGEVDKCLAAGMDDCLVKPVDLRSMHQRLQRWLPLPGEDAADAVDPARDSDTPLDLTLVRDTWGHDPGTVREILRFFQRANNDDTVMLRRAVGARDVTLAARASHRMLGSSKMVGAHDFAGACERIHGAARAGVWEAVDAVMPQFEHECTRLNAYIDSQSTQEPGVTIAETPPGEESPGAGGRAA